MVCVCVCVYTMRYAQVAYCRDMVKVLHHSIAPRGVADGVTMVGRAYTCTGPDIYLNALESIGPGEVFVQGGYVYVARVCVGVGVCVYVCVCVGVCVSDIERAWSHMLWLHG